MFLFQLPIVITDSQLVSSAKKWDIEYLEENMGDGDFSVFLSRNHKFKYHDDKKPTKTSCDTTTEFIPPTRRQDMKLPEFGKRLKEWKRGDER